MKYLLTIIAFLTAQSNAACADYDKTIMLYASVAEDNCRAAGDEKRCEDALFNLAEISYTCDALRNNANLEYYKRAYDKWKDSDEMGAKPIIIAPSYSKSLTAHARYLSSLNGGARRDVILYRTAFILDMVGRSNEVFPILMELSTKYPTSRHAGPANLRLGEYYFVEKKYDSAIAYYNKVGGVWLGNQQGVIGLAIFKKAESLYKLARYDKAIDAFFEYIDRADNGQIESNLRSEAILYIGSCFSQYAEPTAKAKKFFKSKGGRAYENQIIDGINKDLQN